MKTGLALGFVALAALSVSACTTPDQFAVDIDINAGSSMLVVGSDGKTPLADMQSFVLVVSGDETKNYTIAPGRAFAVKERQRYLPGAAARTLFFTINGLDSTGQTIATGMSGEVSLTAGHHSDATITLQVPGFNPVDFAGDDLTGVDLAPPPDMSGKPVTTISFMTPPSSATANAPTDFVSADFDGDGTPDVALTSKMDGKVQVFIMGAGAVLGATPKYTVTVTGAAAIGAGNFGGDTKIDLVVADGTDGTIVFLTNTGTGFTAGTPITVGAGLSSIAVGDFDKDGKPDVAVSSSTVATAWAVYSSNAFATLTSVTLTHPAARLHAPDLNGDGYADLVAVETSGSYVESVLSTSLTSARTFGTPTGLTITHPGDVAFADLNGDTLPDGIAVPNSGTTTATYLANNAGTLTSSATFDTHATVASRAVLADIDGDGKLDLVTTHQPTDSPYQALRIALGTGGASFGTPAYYAFGQLPDGLIVEDIDADGKLDVLVTSPGSNLVSTSRGLGAGAIYAGVMIMPPQTGGTFERPFFADLNGDGKIDIIMTDRDSTLLQLGDGMGNFAAPTSVNGAATVCSGVGDINNDHKLDLVVGDFYGVLGIALGTAPGAFGTLSQTNEGSIIPDIVVEDLDGDGFVDIAITEPNTSSLYVFRGAGTSTLGTKETYAVLANCGRVLVADVNHDGRKDLVTLSAASAMGPGVSVLLGNAAGKLDVAAPYYVGINYPFGLEIFDVDGDNFPDLVVGGDALGYFKGNGDATFATTSTLLSQRVVGVAHADVNRDGKLDLLAAGEDGVHVFISSAGVLVPSGVFLAGGEGNLQNIIAADLTGDGLPEFVTSTHAVAARVLNNSH